MEIEVITAKDGRQYSVNCTPIGALHVKLEVRDVYGISAEKTLRGDTDPDDISDAINDLVADVARQAAEFEADQEYIDNHPREMARLEQWERARHE